MYNKSLTGRKRKAALAMCTIMGIATLAGCGGQESTVTADLTEESTVEESTVEESADSQDAEAAPAEAESSTGADSVVIFTTNDIHGTMVGDEEATIGIVQTAAIAASTPNALLVDAGDAVQGGAFATVSEGEDVIGMMNAAGYDMMALGNHDFDYGLDRLLSNHVATFLRMQ